MEILAPCGSEESLLAAVRCGANAVYLGTQEFNARRNAKNFNLESLKKAVLYCHERRVKVYITVNTLVSDEEMKTAYETIKAALEANADGFIVQDLGVAKMIKQYFPSTRLHASTQCAVNSPEGFKKLEELGFCRAVIPREMSLDEIKEIRKATSMELEVFVHGALCMCVSGQCYLSAMLGSRSGNRGLCAQPCRLPFSADGSGSCDLSLKDLSLISKISELEKAGIQSIKIEGRMKRPEYVAAAVTACKSAINGNYSITEEQTLQRVFSRSGFTDAYLTGKRNDMFGTRQKEDVIAANGVLKQLSRLYEKEKQTLPIDFEFLCRHGKPLCLKATTGGKTATVYAAAPETAINKPLTEEGVINRLSKLGGTPYYLNDIKVKLDNGLIAPASEINKLRRTAVEQLRHEEIKKEISGKFSPIITKEKSSSPYFTARFSNAEQIPSSHPFKRIFIPIYSSNDDFIKTGAGVEIPRGLFGAEEKLKKRLEELKSLGVSTALCSNLGGYKAAEELGIMPYGDYGLNVFNSLSAQQFHSPILSFELSLKQANRINTDDTGIICYGKLPLMITRNCPVENRIGCEKCGKKGTLTDRKGYKFSVKCSSYPCVEIFNPYPLYLADRLDEIKTDFVHFYFTDERKNEIEKIIKCYKNKSAPPFEHTRGLYYRGVK